MLQQVHATREFTLNSISHVVLLSYSKAPGGISSSSSCDVVEEIELSL